MITLIRLFMIKSKEIKYRLAFWQFVDQIFSEINNHPEEFEKKLIDSVVRLIVSDKTTNETKS